MSHAIPHTTFKEVTQVLTQYNQGLVSDAPVRLTSQMGHILTQHLRNAKVEGTPYPTLEISEHVLGKFVPEGDETYITRRIIESTYHDCTRLEVLWVTMKDELTQCQVQITTWDGDSVYGRPTRCRGCVRFTIDASTFGERVFVHVRGDWREALRREAHACLSELADHQITNNEAKAQWELLQSLTKQL
jgi:hypothetical protein